jgi:hypothetical protein
MERLSVVRTFALAVVLASLGCGRESAPPGPLFPIRRLVDAVPAQSRLPWGQYVKIAGEDRLTLDSVDTATGEVVRASPPLAGGPPDEWSAQIPERLRNEPWLLRTLPGTPDLGADVVAPRTTGPVLLTSRPGADPAKPFFVRLSPLPALETRDVVTEPFLVPAGAVLAFGVGIEEAAWGLDAGPIAFRISSAYA